MNQLKSKRSRDPRSSVVLNRSQNVDDSPSGGEKASSRKWLGEVNGRGLGVVGTLSKENESGQRYF